ncbi:MAG: discoidin domain-containing protein [Halioglobus sp.]|nr:discoidin domain-containing protein [Halioglobus sp.]
MHLAIFKQRFLNNQLFVLALLASALFFPALALATEDLRRGFTQPPDSAKPRVWWHWMNGNVSKSGIEADLTWMKRIGIGGLHTTDAGLRTPIVVDPPIPYRSPQWQEAFSHATKLAASLDLEFGLFSSPGWSLTGGPWVAPAQAMKKLVWSRDHVSGGQRFIGSLTPLPQVTGPFQDIPSYQTTLLSDPLRPLPKHGGDTIVIAYRDREPQQLSAVANSNAGALDYAVLTDDNTSTKIDLPLYANSTSVQVDFKQALEIRSATVSAGPPLTSIRLSASLDGKTFTPVRVFYMGNNSHTTATFYPVKARYFRFNIHVPKSKLPTWDATAVAGASEEAVEILFPLREDSSVVEVRELALRQVARVNEFERKAGFQIASDYYAIDTPAQPINSVIPLSEVIDLTNNVTTGGHVDWQVPPGDWVILRLGYSLLGTTNHAASREGTGLEVDKLNHTHVSDYFHNYLAHYSHAWSAPGENVPRLDSMLMDSYEIGTQNWTEDILSQFQRLRGYDPRPWLPTLTGIIVGSAADSDRFLWDFRRTLGDLLIENHYKTSAEIASAYGLQLYGEAMESMRWALGDDMDMRRYTDIPTAAIWAFPPGAAPKPGTAADILGAASVAHIYGQNLVAVESLTSALAPWAQSPRVLKPVIDRAFALGMNRPIIHASVHQPLMDAKPGFSLSFFGQNFSRNDTWAELAQDWMAYMARCSFLLQQGRHVADIGYFYGEEAPLPALFPAPSIELAAGLHFDFVSPDALLNQLSVENGLLQTPGGAVYRVLYLGGSSSKMTLPILRKIRDLVAGGATVVGSRPSGSPSLNNNPAEFDRLVEDVWGGTDTAALNGQINAEETLQGALHRLGVTADVEFHGAGSDTQLDTVHRRLEDGDIFFVSNRSPVSVSLDASFRVTGRTPEFWNPQSVSMRQAPYRFEEGRTLIPLQLGPHQSLFVVFLQPTQLPRREESANSHSVIKELSDDWQLSVPTGAEPLVVNTKGLQSWSTHEDPSIRYFSGTATYRQVVHLEADWLQEGQRLYLDLGDVREFAQVTVNGQDSGTLWAAPYRTDITDALQAGDNQLEVRVTNLWVNRLIGDRQPGTKPSTFTAIPAYTAAAPLFPSGLLGPVRIDGTVIE